MKKRFIVSVTCIMIGIMLMGGCERAGQVQELDSDDGTTLIEQERKGEDTSATEASPKQRKVIFESLESVFGFANESENRLITVSGENDGVLDAPDEYNIAIGDNGEIIKIEYEGYQEANDKNNYRANIYNFDNMEGYIYKAEDGTFRQDKTYFLSKDSLFNEDTIILLVSLPGDSANGETVRKVEEIKGREITDATLITRTRDGGEIYLIVFKRINDDMLASIVYIKDDTAIFKDYPATYDEMSTWRVDGGDDPGLFEVLFLANSDEGLLIGLTWAGAEGENAFILKGNGDTFLETDLMCFRYWSPF